MLTRQQRMRKHFSQLCPFGKPLKISILASKEMPTEARKFEAGGWRQGQAFFRGGVAATRAETQRPKETKCFHLLPKLHDRRGRVLQGHVAMVGRVQFLELDAVLCSGKQDKKHKKITLCEGWCLDNIQSGWCNQVVFTQPLQVNMPQRALWGKSIMCKQFNREAWLDSNQKRSFGGRAPPPSISH